MSAKVEFRLEFCSRRDWDICGKVRRRGKMPGIKEDEPNEGEEASEFDKEFSVEDFVEPKLISEEREKDCETGEDIVKNILIVILSEENKPITFSVLACLGFAVFVGLTCLCCKMRRRTKSRVSRTSSLTSVSRTTHSARSSVRVQTDPMSMEMTEPRAGSGEEEPGRVSKNVFDDSLVMYFNKNNEQTEYVSDEILVTDTKLRNIFSDFDLKEKSLESLEWLKSKVKTTVDDGMDSMDWIRNKFKQVGVDESSEEISIPPRTKKKKFERFDIIY